MSKWQNSHLQLTWFCKLHCSFLLYSISDILCLLQLYNICSHSRNPSENPYNISGRPFIQLLPVNTFSTQQKLLPPTSFGGGTCKHIITEIYERRGSGDSYPTMFSFSVNIHDNIIFLWLCIASINTFMELYSVALASCLKLLVFLARMDCQRTMTW